jgi:carboxypeptidase PM20D1
VPACDVLLAFGHDEEIGGDAGATAIAALLAERGVKPGYVLDEGGVIATEVLPVPTATIGVSEKGYASLRLAVESAGGHSSMPPRETAIGILANAVARIEGHRPAAAIGDIQREGYRRLAPHLPFGQRVVLGNLWLTAPLVERMFAAKPSLDATPRTTTAPTILRAGVKDNVLPARAEAVVNFRIRVGDSIEGVRAHVVDVVDDPRVAVTLEPFSTNPAAPSPWDGPEFAQIERVLRSVSDETPLVVMPFVTVGATDVRKYAVLTDRLYRFMPVKLAANEFDRVHGTNEQLAVAELGRAIRFYAALVRAYEPPRQAALL